MLLASFQLLSVPGLASLLLLTSLLFLESVLLLLVHDAPGTSAAAAAVVTSISITSAVASVPAAVAFLCMGRPSPASFMRGVDFLLQNVSANS